MSQNNICTNGHVIDTDKTFCQSCHSIAQGDTNATSNLIKKVAAQSGNPNSRSDR